MYRDLLNEFNELSFFVNVNRWPLGSQFCVSSIESLIYIFPHFLRIPIRVIQATQL